MRCRESLTDSLPDCYVGTFPSHQPLSKAITLAFLYVLVRESDALLGSALPEGFRVAYYRQRIWSG